MLLTSYNFLCMMRPMKDKLSTLAEKKGACPIPRYVLRGMLIQRGTTLAEWARQRGVRDSTVHNALVGRRTGAKSRRLVAELLEELGL